LWRVQDPQLQPHDRERSLLQQSDRLLDHRELQLRLGTNNGIVVKIDSNGNLLDTNRMARR
jgi:hypothetical protein